MFRTIRLYTTSIAAFYISYFAIASQTAANTIDAAAGSIELTPINPLTFELIKFLIASLTSILTIIMQNRSNRKLVDEEIAKKKINPYRTK